MEEFKKKVQHELIDRNMNFTDLAELMGITVSYLSDILNGNRKSEERIQQITDILGLDVKQNESQPT